MDSLSFLMQILGVIVDCAKVVAVIVAFVALFALIKYFCMKWRGLLPSVVATVFVISFVGKYLADAVGVFSILWSRLRLTVSFISGGMYVMLVVFTVLLCAEIIKGLTATRRAILRPNDENMNTYGRSLPLFGISNSFLSTTPVLLS